jgi:hypothetical protein
MCGAEQISKWDRKVWIGKGIVVSVFDLLLTEICINYIFSISKLTPSSYTRKQYS